MLIIIVFSTQMEASVTSNLPILRRCAFHPSIVTLIYPPGLLSIGIFSSRRVLKPPKRLYLHKACYLRSTLIFSQMFTVFFSSTPAAFVDLSNVVLRTLISYLSFNLHCRPMHKRTLVPLENTFDNNNMFAT